MLQRNRALRLAGFIGLLLAGTACVTCFWFRADASRINVILVTLDTTRADRIGCYGYGAARTPALDELAKSGALFEQARTPCPLTLPAHASILTGLYPPEHGLHVNEARDASGMTFRCLQNFCRMPITTRAHSWRLTSSIPDSDSIAGLTCMRISLRPPHPVTPCRISNATAAWS